MQAICGLLGVPEEDRHELAEAVSFTFDIREGDAAEATSGRRDDLLGYAVQLIAEKRERPTDDMLSTVIHATLGGLVALIEHPDQLDDLRGDLGLLPTAIEEILRSTTPSPAKRRTATVTAELGGHTIQPGEKVLFWEGSANRDEQVFDEPTRFDIRRSPNPHLALGHGVHYCLGANLARLEMRLMYAELLPRISSYELVAPVEWARSNRHTGIRHLHLRLG
jgi:cytochrome P450